MYLVLRVNVICGPKIYVLFYSLVKKEKLQVLLVACGLQLIFYRKKKPVQKNKDGVLFKHEKNLLRCLP
jgi:hypothetical protein